MPTAEPIDRHCRTCGALPGEPCQSQSRHRPEVFTHAARRATIADAPPRPASWQVTCESCPWQVEGQLEDGRWFYLRHRHCSLQLGVGATLDEAVVDTFDPATHVTYHENNAAQCPCHGYCSGVDGEEAAYVWQLAWRHRLAKIQPPARASSHHVDAVAQPLERSKQ